MVQARNDEGLHEKHDMAGKEEVRNKDTSRFLAWGTRQKDTYTSMTKGKEVEEFY